MTTRICSFEGCGRPHDSRGLCVGHNAQRKKGRTLTPLKQYRPQGMSRSQLTHWCLEKAVSDNKGCLNLIGVFRHSGGYPIVSTGNGWSSGVKAGHLVLEMHQGPRPQGAVMRHLCHNPLCINPDHLRWGTQKENIHDTIRASSHGRRTRTGGKLRPFDVRCIRELAQQGITQRDLGERFGISQVMAGRIIRRDAWAHI